MVPAVDERVEEYRREAGAARIRGASNPANRNEFQHVAEHWDTLAREVERLRQVFRQENETVRG